MGDDLGDVAARRAQAEEEWRMALRKEHRRLIDALRERRTALGLTQEQVAGQIGVGRSQIANAESGAFLLSVESLIGYAIAVGARLVVEDIPTSKG